MPPIAILSASPGHPESATTRLLPPPSTSSGMLRDFANSHGLANLVLALRRRKVTRRPTHLQRSQRRQRNIFLNSHLDDFTL